MVCRAFQTLVADSAPLQLILELDAGGLCLLPPQSRDLTPVDILARARRWRKAWMDLDIRQSTRATITVPFVPGSLYELSGGYFFLSVERGPHQRPNRLAYVRLPAHGYQDPGQWTFLNFAEAIMDFAVDVQQDLLCFVEFVPSVSNPNQTFRIHLRSMSDGNPHPQAKIPRLHYVMDAPSPFVHPSVVMQVVGTHVVILFCAVLNNERRDCISVWDWTTGVCKATIGSGLRMMNTFVMLSPDRILVPDPGHHIIEVYRFDPSLPDVPTEPLQPEAQFELPRMWVVHAIFRSEPAGFSGAFTSATSPFRSSKPFAVDPQQCIISFTMQVYTEQGVSEFKTFIGLRTALLAHVERPRAPRKDGEPLFVPWALWRAATLWRLGEGDGGPNWICHTFGQRHIVLEGDESEQAAHVRLYDFNPNAYAQQLRRYFDQRIPDHVLVRFAGVDGEDAGGKPVDPDLKSVEIATKEKFTYAGIMLDEDRIIGLNTNADQDITTIVVFLVGGESRI
ncbi:hypothetical protein AURDEDRAFT_111140 [Auricularia subglabra TFB-10046 SS5]|nr:hypothetical protein AURDEDRAFT_111140 [Auricularia subglabra TFB-10046 SS5]